MKAFSILIAMALGVVFAEAIKFETEQTEVMAAEINSIPFSYKVKVSSGFKDVCSLVC